MERRPYITCRELIEFLSLYIDGELPPERVHEFERHLAVCPSCVEYLASYRTTIALAGRALEIPEDQVDESIPNELVAAILAARGKA